VSIRAVAVTIAATRYAQAMGFRMTQIRFGLTNQMNAAILPMMATSDVESVLRCYPQIYFACHKRHVRDPKTDEILSGHQASVLDHLDDIQPTSLFDLARHMGVTASTMSLTIDRLVRGGYVVRERSEEDRRRLDLRLSAAGLRIKKQQKVLEPELVGAVLAHLDERKRRQALRGLELLAEASRAMIESGDLGRFLKRGAA
jgi:MarR family transcriptional regulator, organic hydroperoxide resistance regulator